MAAARGGKRQTSAVGRPRRRKIGAAEMREADQAVEIDRVHEDLPAGFGQGTERETGTIGRNSRRERDGKLMSDLTLIGAIVIHRPDFFVAGAIAHEKDFALGDAGNAAAEAEDDL